MPRLALIILLFLASFAIGWNSEKHMAAVDSVYYSMPPSIRQDLNLSYMQLGSIYPDKYFKDFKNHKYPYSYNKSIFWLEQAKQAYAKKDFENASYSFGIVTHYIMDSFSAPHYITKEKTSLHSKFESADIKFDTICNNYNETLHDLNYIIKARQDWQNWLETNNNTIQHEAINKAMKIVYAYSIRTFGFECYNSRTDLKPAMLIKDNLPVIFIFALIIILIIRFS